MTTKIVIAGIIVIAGLAFGTASFVETNIEYADFDHAMASHKKVQVKGEWLSQRESTYDVAKGTFLFTMADERGNEMKVVYRGARPNNFELAQAIVVKGVYERDCFQATEILTKCPSKYESAATSPKE